MSLTDNSLANDLLQRAAARGDRALEEKGEAGLEKLLTKLEGMLPTTEDGERDARLAVTRGMTLDAIHRLRTIKPQLVGLTRGALVVFTSYVASGRYAEAAALYLREKAPPEELVGAILQTGDDAVAEREQREQVKKDLEKTGRWIVEELGPVAARYLLPLLLNVK